MRDAGFEVGPGNGFEAQRCVKSDEVLLRRDADGLRTPRPGDMPQGFVHQAAAQPAAAVTGVYPWPYFGFVPTNFTLDDSYCTRMAQLGFIVITVGHRGDTPMRGK